VDGPPQRRTDAVRLSGGDSGAIDHLAKHDRDELDLIAAVRRRILVGEQVHRHREVVGRP
jgi:hypothetical protein